LLTVLWALFAAAAVGVGFGAAGLVGSPFTDGTGDTLTAQGSTTPAATAPSGTAAASRSLRTRGGVVWASCAGGLVSITASPAVNWQLDRIASGRRPTASLEFTRSGTDGKVEVSVHCVGGTPRFALDDASARASESPTATETGDDHGGRSPGGSGSDGGTSGSGSSEGSDDGSGGGRGRG
jgi:hypothetical protein